MGIVRRRRSVVAFVAVLLSGLGTVLVPGAASAATGDVGFQGPSYSGVISPTAEKPESKLWWNDGRWWASMYVPASSNWHIFYLNRSASPKAWVDTGTVLDTRANTLADTLWTGSKLYVASHVKAASNAASASGQPARLYRYSYDAGTKKYSLDAGFPTAINNNSSETLTLDRDGNGRLFATWTQAGKVYVNATTGTSADTWGTPFVLPVDGASDLDADDISTLVAVQGKIGVMWSNQTSTRSSIYFSLHSPTAALGTWSASERVSTPGAGQADDHVNIKQLESDPQGRVYAVFKTSLDDAGDSAPQVVVVSRSISGTGGWQRAVFGTVGECHTRPLMVLDSTNQLLHVFATAPDTPTGCPFPGSTGAIYEKTSPMGSLSFSRGRGTAVIRDAASPDLNNVSGSKQTVNASTGLVLLATNESTKRYWSADLALGSGTPSAPVASFTATPTSGTAPLAVKFTDTSTGSPTSWAWDFGDGTTSTAQSPAKTYSTAGTYTVKLTATNAGGSNTVTKTSLVTVSAATGSGAITAAASSTTYSATATTAVKLGRPSGTQAGDVLVASITADLAPAMSAVPSGWTKIASPTLSGARVYAYYHVVAAGEASSDTWTLGTANKWSGGMTAYRGVSTTSPLDTAAVTATDDSGDATSLALPSITTVTNGALLVGGVGLDSGTTALVSPPSAWTERWEGAGGQIAEQADVPKASAGASGTATWTLSSGRSIAGWRVALRPAS